MLCHGLNPDQLCTREVLYQLYSSTVGINFKPMKGRNIPNPYLYHSQSATQVSHACFQWKWMSISWEQWGQCWSHGWRKSSGKQTPEERLSLGILLVCIVRNWAVISKNLPDAIHCLLRKKLIRPLTIVIYITQKTKPYSRALVQWVECLLCIWLAWVWCLSSQMVLWVLPVAQKAKNKKESKTNKQTITIKKKTEQKTPPKS